MATKSKKNIDAVESLKHLRTGLAIYKVGRSPNWFIRLRDPIAGKYVVRSSKEKTRLEAIKVAHEFADSYHSKADSDLAQKKDVSFEHYANILIANQKGRSSSVHDDTKILKRTKDGLIYYFGKHDVTKITSGMVRDYLAHLDQNRPEPLAASTKSKHIMVIRKVLTLAVEDGLMRTVPPLPKIKAVNTPRSAFTYKEYTQFCKAALECDKRGDVVRGVRVRSSDNSTFIHTVQTPKTRLGLA